MNYELKKLLKRWLPLAVSEEIPILKGYLKAFKYSGILSANREFGGSGRGKSLVIIGNGPSLNTVDLKEIKNADIFACNDFYLHKDFSVLPITHYFNFDPRPWWFQNIKLEVDAKRLHEMKFIFPISYAESVKDGLGLENKYFIATGGEKYFNYRKFLNLHGLTLHIINVLQGLMVSAIYMEYDRIILVGFDYSFLAYKQKNEIPHFHNRDSRAFIAPSESDYVRNVCSACKSLTALSVLSGIAENRGLRIINATGPSSFLDMFESRSFDSIRWE